MKQIDNPELIAQLSQRLQKRAELEKQYASEVPDATEGMSAGGKLLAGIGRGMDHFGRRAVNLLLPDKITPEFASDKKLADLKETDKALMNTAWGKAGNFVGEMALAMPMGGVVGAGLKAGKAGAAGAKVASMFPKSAGANTILRGATEGAAHGAVLSDPGEGVGGAMSGAMLGGAFSAAGQGLKKTLRGLTAPTDAARRYMDQTGEFIPAHLAAKEGAVKDFYKHFVRAVPFGAKGKINRQTQSALEGFRQTAAARQFPDKFKGILNAADDIPQIESKMKNFWDAEKNPIYSQFKDYVFGTGRGIKVADRIAKEFNDDTAALGIQIGKTMRGDHITRLKTLATQKAAEAGTRHADRVAWEKVARQVDDIIKNELTGGTGKAGRISQQFYDDYLDMNQGWGRAKVLEKAIDSASKKSGRFTPGQLASATKNNPGAYEDLSRLAIDSGLENLPPDPGFFQAMAVLGAAGGLGAVGGPLAAATIIPAASGLASQSAQRFVMGMTPAQRAAIVALRKNAPAVRRLGRAARLAAGSSLYGSDD